MPTTGLNVFGNLSNAGTVLHQGTGALTANANNAGAGSLRQAILDANAAIGPDEITFDAALNGQTITLTTGEFTVSDGLTINGPGAANLTISGNDFSRIFSVGAGVPLTLDGLTLTDGRASSGAGGAILNAGNLTLSNSVIVNSYASGGGAIYSTGALTLTASTVARNDGNAIGGGIYQVGGTLAITGSSLWGNVANGPSGDGAIYLSSAAATITNSTLSGNAADESGAAVRVHGSTLNLVSSTVVFNTGDYGALYTSSGGTIDLQNTIVANNTGTVSTPDIFGSISSQGYNLIGNTAGMQGTTQATDLLNVDPKLGRLQDNGSGRYTHALLPGSPAIDAGNSTLAADQRGNARPQDSDQSGSAAADVGAFELTTYVVASTNDSGAGSLRQAILDANAHAGIDAITFNLPGSGVQNINVSSDLPAITEAVILDGYSQPGASANTLATGNDAVPLIELTGFQSGVGYTAQDGLTLSNTGSVIQGLVINRVGRYGIHVQGGGGHVLAGNFIGTDATGMAAIDGSVDNPLNMRTGSHGIYITGSAGNLVGGTTPAARNVISPDYSRYLE